MTDTADLPDAKSAKRPAPAPAARRASMESSFDSARDTASRAVARTKDAADDALRSAAQGIEANPIGVLAGGIVLGLIAGLFVPRSEREEELLAPVGKKLNKGARDAASAAVEAGKAELAAAGLSKVAANEQFRTLVDGVGKAITSASTAAKTTAKATAKTPAKTTAKAKK